ncbi:MAG: ribosomal L7Ae/L30e/S12e/Gadd45 family protein [Clostridia bacterium]|nr:ribosomal L7Ae/L30e/S12e/Gadd45 family protein [Clostridia bacterium]
MNQTETEKLLRYVGLCKRAGGIVRGADLIEKSLRKRPAPVCVLLASDASGRTAKQTTDKCRTAGVLCVTVGADKFDLAHAVGASSPCAAVALLAGKGPAEAAADLVREHAEQEQE